MESEIKTNNVGCSPKEPDNGKPAYYLPEPEEREYKMAELYVQAARTTTKRCYWAYSALLLVCITAGLTFYNEYCSYMEKMIKMSGIVLSEPLKSEYVSNLAKGKVYTPADVAFYTNNNPIFDSLWREQIRNWVETQYMSIPLLGIKLSTSDVMAIMSFLFVIIMAWCYYCIRSENFAVGKVLVSTQNSKFLDVKKYVFYGICFNNIFFPTTSRDTPYKELKRLGNVVTEISTHQKKLDHNHKPFVKMKRYIPKILFLLPIVMLCVDIGMHISDLYTLDSPDYSCFKELIKNPDDPNATVMAKACVLKNGVTVNNTTVHFNGEKIFRFGFPHGITNLANSGSTGMIWKSLIMTSVILVIVVLLMHQIFKYLNGTSSALREYKKLIKDEQARDRLMHIFAEKGCLDDGKKVVDRIILANSQTKDSRMFDSNVYFGLTGIYASELQNHLSWAIEHLEGAQDAANQDDLRKDIQQIRGDNRIEHYLLFMAKRS